MQLNKSQKLLIVKPFGGLANRLRVISSMLWLKKNFNCKLKVIWLANDELNASYYDLFQIHSDFEVMESLGRYKYVRTSNQKDNVKRVLAKIANRVLGIDYCAFDTDFYKGFDHIIDIVKSNNTIFFNTCEELIQYDEGLISIKLIIPIQAKITKMVKLLNISSNTIGLHIRRTDHKIAINNSPLYLFENAIIEELSNNLKANFYLASDDPEVILYFSNKFGKVILFIEKEFGRNSKGAIMDGLLELYILSKTKKIYGSYWSSYSKTAGRLSDTSVEILKLSNE